MWSSVDAPWLISFPHVVWIPEKDLSETVNVQVSELKYNGMKSINQSTGSRLISLLNTGRMGSFKGKKTYTSDISYPNNPSFKI